MPDEPIFPSGSILDERYELEHLLGKGGGGQVYRARQRSTGQAVAVKVLDLEAGVDEQGQERRRARFRREMQICGRLEHPDIVGLIDFGDFGGSLYAVFELVPGRTLAQLLHAEGSLALARCHSLMRQLLEVLVYAHGKGVIHRDLKPSNIMVLGEPGRERIKVLDFGVSAVPRGTSGMLTRLTLSNEMVGTPAYAAPEQLRGDAPTAKTDLYAWGLILLECLTGAHVMMGASLGEIFSRQLSPFPVPIPSRLREHPLGTLLRWVLEKDPARRAGSAADVLGRFDAIALDDLADDGGYYADAPGSFAHRPGSSPARNQLTETASALLVAGERRQVTALCCRLPLRCAPGITDAMLLDAYRSDLFSLCRSTVEELGGTLVGGAGDLALFYFGLPRAKDTDARMAMRAALELSARIRARSATLTAQSQVSVALKAGIHTGLLTAEDRSTSAAFAHGMVATVATALALRDGADGETSITVSEAFRHLAHRHGEFGASSRMDVGWQPDPIVTHQLVGESLSEVFGQQSAPLIGRDDQLARLVAAWRESTERGRVALIRGEAGIGKSRLAHELGRVARGEGKGSLTLRFLPQMEHVALGPLLELLREELGFDRDQAPTCAAVAAVQRDFEVELDTAVPLLCTWMSVPIEAPFAPLPYSPPMQRGMLYELLVDLVRQLLGRASGFLLVEDLHWADPSTFDWLGHFIARLATSSGFVLMTARPQLAWRWESRLPLLIDLEPLRDTQVSALIAGLPSAALLSTQSIREIVERADGVPLFAEELARAMADVVGPTLSVTTPDELSAARDVARPPRGASRHGPEGARPDEVPAPLRDLLTSRLDSLGPARETAQVAAAIGREFELELLRASLPRDEATLLSDLDQLMASGLVVARRHVGRPGYLFRHALLRDVAYESLTDAARQAVHGAIASALLGEFPARVEARPDLAALHLELAAQPYEAQEHWRVAGSKNMKDLAYEDAIAHFRRGLDVLTRCPAGTPRDEAELDLLNALSGAHINRHGYGSEQLVGIFGRMRQLLDQAVEPRERELPALWTQCMLDMIRPNLTRARPCAETMLAKASALGNLIFVSLAHAALSRIEFWMGNHAGARRHHDECERLHDVDRDKLAVGITGEPPYISSLCFFTVSRVIQGYADAAVTEQEEGLKLSRSYEIPMIYMAHKSNLAWLHIFRGMTAPASHDLQIAHRHAQKSGEDAARFGFPQWQIYAGMIASAARIFQGDRDEVATLQTLMGAWEGAGADIHFCWLLGCVAHGLLLQSDFDQAAQVLARARAHVDRSAEHMFDSQLLRLEARLLEATGGAGEHAEARLLEALAVAERQEARLFALYAANDLLDLPQGARHAGSGRLDALSSWWRASGQGRDVEAVQRFLARS